MIKWRKSLKFLIRGAREKFTPMHDVCSNSCVLAMLASEWPGGQVHTARAIWYCTVDHNATYISAARAAARGHLPGSCWQRQYHILLSELAARLRGHMPRTVYVTYKWDRLSCSANSLWHLLRRWSLWGHRMRSCQYRATSERACQCHCLEMNGK